MAAIKNTVTSRGTYEEYERGTPISLSTKLTLLANQKLLLALIKTRREIVSRAAALMNGEEA